MKNPGKLSHEELLKDEILSIDDEETSEAIEAAEEDEEETFADAAATEDDESQTSPDGDFDLEVTPSGDEEDSPEEIEAEAGDEVAAVSAEPDVAAEEVQDTAPEVNEMATQYAEKTPRGARPKDTKARVTSDVKWVLPGQDGYAEALPPRPKGEKMAKAAQAQGCAEGSQGQGRTSYGRHQGQDQRNGEPIRRDRGPSG